MYLYNIKNETKMEKKFTKGQTVICNYDTDQKVLVVKSDIFNWFDYLYSFSNSSLIVAQSDLRYTVLEAVKFEYKGAIEARAAIRAKADKDPKIQALKAALERGKELSCAN